MQSSRNFTALSLILIFTATLFAQTNTRLRLAQNYERSGDYESALGLYLDFYNSGDENFVVLRGIQKCYSELNQYQQLIDFLENLKKKRPVDINIQVDLASAYYLNQEKEKAFTLWEALIKANANRVSVYRLVAHKMTEFRLIDEAVDVYLQAVKEVKGQEQLYRDIAYLRRAQLDYEQASFYLMKFYQHNQKQLNYVRSQFISMAKDDDAAQRILNSVKSFADNNPKDAGIQELKALMHIRLKDFAPAFEIYKKLADVNKMRRFADDALQAQNYNYALKACSFLLEQKQNITQRNALTFFMANIHTKWAIQAKQSKDQKIFEKQLSKSSEILTPLMQQKNDLYNRWQAFELNGDIQDKLLYDSQKALENYLAVINESKRGPLHDRNCLKVANIYIQQNDLEKAAQQLKKVSDRKYVNQASFQLATLNYFRADFSNSLKGYKTLLAAIGPADTLFNNIYKQMTHIETQRNDSLTLAQYASAELLEVQKNYAEAAAMFEEISKQKNRLAFKSGLRAAENYIKLDQLRTASELLEQLSKNYPQANEMDLALLNLAQIRELENKPQDALTIYLQMIAQYPASFYLDAARDRAREIQKSQGADLN